MRVTGLDNLSFDERGLIPAIVQDGQSREVLMLAYMSKESLEQTLRDGETWFYSRSRQELWHKGATSGNTQSVESIAYDCDGDTLLIQVTPRGPACHTGKQSCFYRQLTKEDAEPNQPVQSLEKIITTLYTLIQGRKASPIEDSYTCYLFDKGLDKILKKVGEETAEVIIGAKNPSPEEVVYEISDLTYHLLVLMVELGVEPAQISAELAKRAQ